MNIFQSHYQFLKNEAEILLKLALLNDKETLSRLRMDSELSSRFFSEQTASQQLQLKHILEYVARENSYPSWSDLKKALDHAAEHSPLADVGEQFYPKGFTTYWNIWFAKYSQAKKVLDEGKGYLLPYKHQYFIVEEHFVDSLGLSHTLPEWKTIGNDWVHPKNVKAWLTLNEQYSVILKERQSSL